MLSLVFCPAYDVNTEHGQIFMNKLMNKTARLCTKSQLNYEMSFRCALPWANERIKYDASLIGYWKWWYCSVVSQFGSDGIVYLPISSINGAIRSVTPTKSKHITSNRHAVAMIVQRARCDKSSGSITCASETAKIKYKHNFGIGVGNRSLS